MTYQMTSEQQGIRDAIFRICEEFDDEFWLDRDREGGFPHELHQKLARDGWLGIAIPEEYGGAGLGIVDAAIMMQAIAESGGGNSAASAVHMNIFGLSFLALRNPSAASVITSAPVRVRRGASCP